MKEGSLQIRLNSDNASVIFSMDGPGYSEMAMEHGLCRSTVNVDVYTEFEPLEVKVPLIFSGTVGFPRRRDGR